ncbi:MAG: MG2 domain-containing protein [Clostridium sp.]|nr:MG2 domain-containing protein [Clostridium sp.]
MRLHVRSTIRRTTAFVAAAIILATAAILAVCSCNRKTMADEEAAQWIAAYTPAHIDMDSKIRIETTEALRRQPDLVRLGDNCFEFSPSVKGRAVMSADRRFIDFIPDHSLEQGRRYHCRLRMDCLTGIDSLADFGFSFVVDRREIRLADIRAEVDPDDVSMMTVTGRIEYNVRAGDSLTAGAILVCDSPAAKITLDKQASSRNRRFRISGIRRLEKPSAITISTNPLGGFSRAEAKVDIPALADFSLLSAERVEAAEPFVELRFSAPLSSTQELDGLITIDGLDDLAIERDGCNVRVRYPRNSLTDLTLRVSDLVRNREGRALDSEIEQHFAQEVIPPAIEIPIEGSILPDNRNLRLPFRAVNLAAVDVEVIKIFPGNVMAFLQENDLDSYNELRRFGRLIFHKTVRLDRDRNIDLRQWQNFSIDLEGLFRKERGAVYNIRLSFRRAYSLYDRAEPEKFDEIDGLTAQDRQSWDRSRSWIYREAPDSDWRLYDWHEANDPSKPSYYMDDSRMPERNLVASDLGIIAKQGQDNRFVVAVTNLIAASPAPGISVTAWNYQMQPVGRATTDASGFATIEPANRPFMLTATDGQSTTYLKVRPDYELSTSSFDVSGREVTDGVKGFVYGDRGVWRPGDDIHLTLILEDKQRNLPKNHPVALEFYNPSEQLVLSRTMTESVDGFYHFAIPTDPQAPTGLWEARFKVGNQTFGQKVRVETIKPNRLKVNIDVPEVLQADRRLPIGLDARWLTGPAAVGMQAALDMTLYNDPAPFPGFKTYSFSNPLVSFESSETRLFADRLDSVGAIRKICTIGVNPNTPGMLRANLTAKVTEPGGDASMTSLSLPLSPFGVYVGIDLSAQDYLTDTDLGFPVVVVNQKGQRMKTRELDYKIYRLGSEWWWETSAEYLNRYILSSYADLVADGRVTATNGRASIPFRIDYPDWGKFLLLVRDTKGGHATGGVVRIDWPDWRGRADRDEEGADTRLSFTLDKKSYEAGETANVYLPECGGGRALLSVENGSGVLKRYWIATKAGSETCFKLPVDGSMAPNFYVTATLLRPHRATTGDLPIRLFGIQCASVIDRRTILTPEITMPDELHPGEPFSIRIRERDNRPMTYTVAIVDEGLLDITGFRTPRPWQEMNQREALGVRTWDMYDDVFGAFGSQFRPVLSIGGDEALRKSAGKEKRFNPVVRFLGPFTLPAGSKTHRLTLPNYVGSVRVMVVAAHDGCYGNSDKTVPVTSPLMLLTTLPRQLSCGDEATMPVNLFAMRDDIRDVTVTVETSGPVRISSDASRRVTFDSNGDKLVGFRLACDNSREGTGRVVVTASCGQERMSDTTWIAVSNPMPAVISTTERTLAAGESATLPRFPKGTESVSLQVAAMPAISFGGAMDFFEGYSHLCSEQLSSKGIFMLTGREFLDEKGKSSCEIQLPELIKTLCSRQTSDGGFTYWPGAADSDPWVTSMAGVVLAEADRQGFRIGRGSLENWISFQESAARNYRQSSGTDLDQAFRLYSLALAGKPSKPAMNRLRESKRLSQTAAYCLASAYALAGRSDVATALAERAGRTEYTPSDGLFASDLRDQAIRLESLSLCGLTAEATREATDLAGRFGSGGYVTQETAFATLAFRALGQKTGTGAKSVSLAVGGKSPVSLRNFGGIRVVDIDPAVSSAEITNTGNGSVVISVATTVRPEAKEPFKGRHNNLRLSVVYTDLDGHPVRTENLRQDAEFQARITVVNDDGDIGRMALTYMIPAGWEIWNTRLFGRSAYEDDYYDLRDNRVSFYAPLHAGGKLTYTVRLRAAYAGKYLLPPTVCEDMYNPSSRALTGSSWVSVVK